jgi:hypothetical protein
MTAGSSGRVTLVSIFMICSAETRPRRAEIARFFIIN